MEVSDICTLVWPLLRTHPTPTETGESLWIVGWNPRSLFVVVTSFIRSMPLSQAEEQLEWLKQSLASCPTPPHLPTYASLRIVGSVRGASTKPPAGDPEGAIRTMRQRSDIWLELNHGPLLGEVWCCGYRVQPCQLHVLRFDPALHYAVQPFVWSPLSLYGVAGVRQLQAGRQPLCREGVSSRLEGVLLPSVMVRESGPRPCPPRPCSPVDTRPLEAPPRASLDDSWVSQNEENGSFTRPAEFLRAVESSLREGHSVPPSPPRPPPPGIPPRLDFPTSVDAAEMSVILAMCRAGHPVRRLLEAPSTTTTTAAPWRTSKAVVAAPFSPVGGVVGCVLNEIIRGLLLFLRVITALSHGSFLAIVLQLRLRELVHLLSILGGRTRVCGLHPVLPHQLREAPHTAMVCCGNFISRLCIDATLGLLMGVLLVVGGPPLFAASQGVAQYFLYELHLSYMSWFDGWPAGLKMNEDLNMTLCFFARVVLDGWHRLMRGIWDEGGGGGGGEMNGASGVPASVRGQRSAEYIWIHTSYAILVRMCLLGASCAFAFVADLTWLVTLHLQFLYHAIVLPYRFVRSLLHSLFEQFRGTKRNPLRNRTDTYDFSVDQMLLGTFLFTIVVFLFPTLFVYYLYFALIRASIWMVQEALVALAHVVFYCPVFPILHWAWYRRKLPGGVTLSSPLVAMKRSNHRVSGVGPAMAPSYTVEFTLQSRPLSLHSMTTEFWVVLGTVLRPFQPMGVLSRIFRGNLAGPTNPLGELIPHLVANCIDPPCTLCVGETHTK